MSNAVVPVSRALYLCDYHVGYQDGKVDLYGVFGTITPRAYPHTQSQFVVFVQLTGGLGDVPFFIDIRHAGRNELVRTTGVNTLHFPDRLTLVQLALTIEGCRFPTPGLYVVELFCHNTWVCDTTLLLQ